MAASWTCWSFDKWLGAFLASLGGICIGAGSCATVVDPADGGITKDWLLAPVGTTNEGPLGEAPHQEWRPGEGALDGEGAAGEESAGEPAFADTGNATVLQEALGAALVCTAAAGTTSEPPLEAGKEAAGTTSEPPPEEAGTQKEGPWKEPGADESAGELAQAAAGRPKEIPEA